MTAAPISMPMQPYRNVESDVTDSRGRTESVERVVNAGSLGKSSPSFVPSPSELSSRHCYLIAILPITGDDLKQVR